MITRMVGEKITQSPTKLPYEARVGHVYFLNWLEATKSAHKIVVFAGTYAGRKRYSRKIGSVGSPPPPAIIVMNGLRISSVMSILVIKYEQDKKMSLVMQH